jgi:hypothetical protein
MTLDASLVVSVAAALFALLSWLESRRMVKLTVLALERQSHDAATTLPCVEALGVVDVNGKHRAKLIVFNQRSTTLLVNCVQCFRYTPKRWTPLDWLRDERRALDRHYTQENGYWNPKGSLDDDEHYAGEALPFTSVADKEILLITLNCFQGSAYQRYRFLVMTSQGDAWWEGVLPNGMTSLPLDHRRVIS